jgi:hypothetical protein
VATIAILQHRSTIEGAALIDQLNEALDSRIIIEWAKGTIGEAAGTDMEPALWGSVFPPTGR